MITEELSPKREIVALSPRKEFYNQVRKQKELILISVPFFIYFFIFSYLPLWGLTMAFQNYKPARTFFEQEWVGFKHFRPFHRPGLP